MENKQNVIYISIGVFILIALFYFLFFRISEQFTSDEVTLITNYMNAGDTKDFQNYLDFLVQSKIIDQKWYKPDTYYGLISLKKIGGLDASNVTKLMSTN